MEQPKSVTYLQPEGHNLLVRINEPMVSGQPIPSIRPVSNEVQCGTIVKASPIGTGNLTEGTVVYFPVAASQVFLDGTAQLQLSVVSEKDIIASRRTKLPVQIQMPGLAPRGQY